MYSFRMSFWMVPRNRARDTPCFSAVTRYMAQRMAAGPLMVMEVETWSKGMPSKRVSMSSRESMATPSRPTSPRDRGWSESYPKRVGMSKATESPVWPCSSRYLKRALVSEAVPKPANWRMVQSRPRYMVAWIPRVSGYSPGKPSLAR